MSSKSVKHLMLQFFVSILALLCIAPISIPLTILPLTLQTFVLSIIAFWFGWTAFWATLTYIGIGLFGAPVFSGFKSNPDILLSSSAGFVVGFALMVGLIIRLKTKPKLIPNAFLLFVVAHVALILFAFLFNTIMGYAFPSLKFILLSLLPSLCIKSALAGIVVKQVSLPHAIR